MKKYSYIFLLSVISLMTACSAEDNASAGQQPEDTEMIRLGVGAPAYTITRAGTGTVGSSSDATNLWNGQHFKAFMTTKEGVLEHTLDDLTFVAPTGAATGTATTLGSSVAYPSGAHNFYAYHLGNTESDEPSGAPSEIPEPLDLDSPDPVFTLSFAIDGSMDVMTATTAEVSAETLTAKGLTADDLFSKKSARAGIHPNLVFNHHLTRFVFTVRPKDASAAGIKIKSIKLKGKTHATLKLENHEGTMRWSLKGDPDEPSPTEYYNLVLKQSTGNTPADALTELDAKVPAFDTDLNEQPYTQIGDALMVLPGDEWAYGQIELQKGDDDSQVITRKFNLPATDVKGDDNKPAGITEYAAGKTYFLNFTVAGDGTISLSAVLEAWKDGGTIGAGVTTYE